MGRDYFGLISGRIPRDITDELPFVDMGCTFEGYLQRFEGCGCCVYETDDNNLYLLQTECHYNGNHKTITRDTSMARWSINRSSIHLLHEKIRYLEMFPTYEEGRTAPEGRKEFMLKVMTQILEAFDQYRLDYTITFTSECV